jgi:hypothetical protein
MPVPYLVVRNTQYSVLLFCASSPPLGMALSMALSMPAKLNIDRCIPFFNSFTELQVGKMSRVPPTQGSSTKLGSPIGRRMRTTAPLGNKGDGISSSQVSSGAPNTSHRIICCHLATRYKVPDIQDFSDTGRTPRDSSIRTVWSESARVRSCADPGTAKTSSNRQSSPGARVPAGCPPKIAARVRNLWQSKSHHRPVPNDSALGARTALSVSTEKSRAVM